MSGLVSKDQTSYSLKLMDPAFKTLIMDESKLIRFTEGFPSFSLQAGSNTVRVFLFFCFFVFLRFIRARKLGMVRHAHNPSTWQTEVGGLLQVV